MDLDSMSRQWIGGQWREGSGDQVLVDRNPFDSSVLAEFPVATVDDVDKFTTFKWVSVDHGRRQFPY